MFVAIYEDGSPVESHIGNRLSEEEFMRIVVEEGYSKCYVEAGLQKGFIVVIEDDDGFEIKASYYYGEESMRKEIVEVNEEAWEKWCK